MLGVGFINILGLLVIGCEVEARQREEGDVCTMINGASGVCKLPEKCSSIYDGLLNREVPGTICGFVKFQPIICCPNTSTAPNPVTTKAPEISEQVRLLMSTTETLATNRNPFHLARRKCSEYSSSVFVLEDPPRLMRNRKPVNRSLCVVTSQLIVGGTKAESKEFPHMAAVGFDSPDRRIVWGCGGTLLSERFVLTAAHCTHSIEYGSAGWVRLGDLNLVTDNDDTRPQELRIVERIRHPAYKKPSTYHDIALLKMDRSVVFDAWVRPACLPTTRDPEGSDAVATGWGRLDWTDDEGSNHLLKVNLRLVSVDRCNASYGSDNDYRLRRGIVDDWQICAGEPGRDTCQGDSGGPLVVFTPTEFCMYDVVGVTSLGRVCGSIIPGVYTRVYNYVSWIESIVWRPFTRTTTTKTLARQPLKYKRFHDKSIVFNHK